MFRSNVDIAAMEVSGQCAGAKLIDKGVTQVRNSGNGNKKMV